MSNYILREVKTATDEQKWLHVDRAIYKDYPNWVCPLDNNILAVFDKSRNKKYNDGEAIRWYVEDTATGEAVARIAAFYDHETANGYEQPTGGCGFFECPDSQEIASMMFDAAKQWLKERGMEAMDGPVNFGPRDSWWGLLVEGFDYQPLYENPYNPPYYKALFENYGFQNYFNQNSYLWRVYEDNVSDVVLEKASRVMATPGYRFENVSKISLEQAAENLRVIYNKAWALFTGVNPMTKEEAQKLMNMLKPIIDPNVIFFAYYENNPIGFFVMVPDLNRLIGKFNGKFGLWQKLRLMWDLKVRKACDRLFGIIFAITPEFQGKGIESGMMKHILDTYVRTDKNLYTDIEFAWIGDFNPVMNRMIERYVCARRHKMHTTYRYLFDRTKEFTRCPRVGFKKRPQTAQE